MTAHTRVSGVWKEITGMHTKVSGAWKEITEGWVNVSGTWKQFFSSAGPFVDSHTATSNGVIVKGFGSARASFEVNSDGTLSSDFGTSLTPAYDDGVEWLPVGTPSDWHVRVTATGDTGDMTGLSLSTWYACTAQREWAVEVSGGLADSATVTLTVAFSDDGGSTTFVTYSSVITLTASIS